MVSWKFCHFILQRTAKPSPLFLNFNPIAFLVAEHFVEMSIFTVYISITQFFQQILHSHIFFERKKGQACNYSLHQICWIKTKTQFLDEEVIFWQINGKKNLDSGWDGTAMELVEMLGLQINQIPNWFWCNSYRIAAPLKCSYASIW